MLKRKGWILAGMILGVLRGAAAPAVEVDHGGGTAVITGPATMTVSGLTATGKPGEYAVELRWDPKTNSYKVVAYGAAAIVDDFIGTWKGTGTFGAEDGEGGTFPITLVLAKDGTRLAGTYSEASDGSGALAISGPVLGGVFTWDVPTSTPGHPDCAGWDLHAWSVLDTRHASMTVTMAGTVCGAGGGKEGWARATLTRP